MTERALPPLAMSIMATLDNKTGTWRYMRPVYEDKTPPCNDGCPAGEDILGYLALIKKKRYEEAWRLLTKANPFPGICGRVCPHPCEQACNHSTLGGAVAIHALERFLADEAARQGWWLERAQPMTNRAVAVIGAGPAGLSCAYQLVLLGHPVTVYESHDQPGGMMRLIPHYRLPADVLAREIGALQRLGVRILTGQRLGDNLRWAQLREYGVLFIAAGQSRSRTLGIPGEEAGVVLSGIDFLARVERGESVKLGRMVVVIGGGNTAMDAARTARRLGAQVMVLYRRTRKEMTAAEAEVAEAEEEGVEIRYLTTPTRVLTDAAGVVQGIECIRMFLGEPDASGRPTPVPIPGSEQQIAAHNVILALGQEADLAFLGKEAPSVRAARGQIQTDEYLATSAPGIFAGGDIATGQGTVTHAVGSGRRAARAIHQYLVGGQASASVDSLRAASAYVVRLQDLNQDHLEISERTRAPQLAPDLRVSGFAEVNGGFLAEDAEEEAWRCFSCGACNGCDTCLVHCPDVAVKREPDSRYSIDYDYCKGCGICVVECPRDAMSIAEEAKWQRQTNSA